MFSYLLYKFKIVPSVASNHGCLVWTSFDSAVELTQIVRQTESEQQLSDVLMSRELLIPHISKSTVSVAISA